MTASELGEKTGRASRWVTLTVAAILLIADHFPHVFSWLPRPAVRMEQKACIPSANNDLHLRW